MFVTPEAVREQRQRLQKECRAQGLDQEQTARRVLEAYPDHPTALLALGTARLEAREFEAAAPLLWGALGGAPSNPGYYLPLMILHREQGESRLAHSLAELAFWKLSFYEEVPEGLATALAKEVPSLADQARDPGIYRLLAEKTSADRGDEPWPERLLPYRLLNDVQRQADGGLEPELIDEIREHAAACAPLFETALREAYDSQHTTLSVEAEAMLVALLGEIGGVELIDDLIDPPFESEEATVHAHWALWRLGQRFPEAAFVRLRAAVNEAGPDLRATIAQQLYFLREQAGAREAILALLDGFPGFAAHEGAPYLLLTVSTLMALMGAPGESLAAIKRHERQLSKDGRRWMNDAIEAEESFVPDLIHLGIDTLDAGDVCSGGALMPEHDEGFEEQYDDEEEYEDEEYEEPAPAVKPGRNDPCWCGSGKKYKKCHLQKDEEEDREEVAREAEDQLFGDTWRQMLDFSRKFHGRSDMDQASRRYFGRDIAEVDAETLEESGFVPWYVLDFRAKEGGRTVLEEFVRRGGARVTDRAQALIESWRTHRYGLWEVQRIEEGRGVEARDIFSGETFFVEDVNTSRTAHLWDCLISRVHQFEGRWLFLADGFLVPRPLLAGIRESVEDGARASRTNPAEYFRSRSHEWRRVLVDAHEKQRKGLRLVNYDGDPIEFSSAEYELADAQAAAAALRSVRQFEETEPDRFAWMGEEVNDGGRRSYGHIEIGGGRLRLECNSRRRLEVGRGIVEEHCGAAVRHVRDTFQSVDDLKEAAAKSEPAKEAKGIDPAVEREVVLKYYAEHYAKWVDEPLPALQGRTPREAARSKSGRRAVEELLRDMENSADRARKSGRPAFDFSGLRATLGL